MKIIKYKFLIFILFLSPFVQAIDAVNKTPLEPTVIVKPSCHEAKQTIQDHISMDCECKDCSCGCFYNNLTLISSNTSKSFFNNHSLTTVFNNVVPNQESHPPFRPPII